MSQSHREFLTYETERWNAHDLDLVYGFLDENYREYLNGVLVKEGRAATRAADQFFYETLPDYHREIEEMHADDDGGAMRWRIRGTGPNGPVEMAVAAFFRIEHGKITECWLYGDPAQFAYALGIQ